jgi:hypothetical protein
LAGLVDAVSTKWPVLLKKPVVPCNEYDIETVLGACLKEIGVRRGNRRHIDKHAINMRGTLQRRHRLIDIPYAVDDDAGCIRDRVFHDFHDFALSLDDEDASSGEL